VLSISAGNWPVEIKLSGFHQNVADKKSSPDYGVYAYQPYSESGQTFSMVNTGGFGFSYLGWPDSVDAGYGLEAEMRYIISDNIRLSFQIGYDYMHVYQWDVLDEWDWDYWEKTYIEFIPALTVDQANKTFRYNYKFNEDGQFVPDDSMQFSAKFLPIQRLKELRLGIGGLYRLPVTEKFSAQFRLDGGVSLYTRQLHMREDWIKRFNLSGDSTQIYDYEYKLNLLHYAPLKKGARFYLTPGVGLNYQLNNVFDFEFDFRFLQYIDRKYSAWLEDVFGFPSRSEEQFPVYSKYFFQFGLVFKY